MKKNPMGFFSSKESSKPTSTETTPLFSSSDANRLAQVGTGVLNETALKIRKLHAEGPFTFRILGLVGGLAVIFSNSLMILGRIVTLNFTGAIIALYNIVFGVVIVLLEGDSISCGDSSRVDGRRLQQLVRYYAKFLEFSWGRGCLYFFVGTLQVSNWNLIDWIVGGFMMFVGISAIIAGIKTAKDLRTLRVRIANDGDLKKKFKKR